MIAQLLIGYPVGEFIISLVWLSLSLSAVELVAGGTMLPSVLRGVGEIMVGVVWGALTVAFGLVAYAIGRFWTEDDDE